MQKAIDRVMDTYRLLIKLTAEQEQDAREKVTGFLASAPIRDENQLAVEGLRYLRTFHVVPVCRPSDSTSPCHPSPKS
jgi:hypothetical protein